MPENHNCMKEFRAELAQIIYSNEVKPENAHFNRARMMYTETGRSWPIRPREEQQESIQ
jgi:hypothetical protein